MENKNNFLDRLAVEVWKNSKHYQHTSSLDREKYRQEARLLLRRMNTPKRMRMRRIIVSVVSVAAMFLLIWGGVYLGDKYAERQIPYLVAETSFGERKLVVLPDSTRVYLNACSRLRYPKRFLGDTRLVELSGEGFFEVQRDEQHPFLVSTTPFEVKVLGTTFNVRAYASDCFSSVHVESGRVQVEMSESMLRLKAHELLRIDGLTGGLEKQSRMREVAMWRNGFLRFDNTPLREVAKELERVYACHIFFERGKTFDNLISGEHDNSSLEAVLRSLSQTAGVTYRMEGDNIFLYKE